MRIKLQHLDDAEEKQTLAKKIADAQAYKDDWVELEATTATGGGEQRLGGRA